MKERIAYPTFIMLDLLVVLFVIMAGCPSPQQSKQQQAEKPKKLKVIESQDVEPAAPDSGSEAEIADEVGANQGGDDKPETLFDGWDKPLLTLYFTGRQHGYIEPCGCTGLANQKGGLNRRHTFLNQLIEKEWNPVPIDLGNQVRRFGRQPDIKFQTTIDGLKKIKYAAIGLGPDDLLVSGNELLSAHIGTDGAPAPFVCANVNVLEQTKPYIIVEKADKKIGVTCVVGKRELRSVTSDEIEITEPVDALREALPKLAEEKCDLTVLLAQTTIEEAEALAKQFDAVDLVVVGGGVGEPSNRLLPIEGSDAKLVQVGAKGMYVSVVGLFDDDKEPLRLQRTPLDGRFADSPEMLALMASYQQQLEAVGFEGLELKRPPHPSGHTFVGSETCADCHEAEYEIWKETPHAHGTDSLVHPGERSEIPRHHDPECLSCHVTGWRPQDFAPYKSGYVSLEKTKHLTQMGCENCHGPGSAHVAAENGELDDLTDDMLQKYRDQMVLKLEDARQTCLECHDLDNSPDFHEKGAFEEYWLQIEH